MMDHIDENDQEQNINTTTNECKSTSFYIENYFSLKIYSSYINNK